jgi:hypothetical protein
MTEPTNDVPALLTAMRFVTSHPKNRDRHQMHHECRKWLEENRGQFLAKMADLEKVQLAKEKPEEATVPGGTVAEDAGTERALALIERLLAEANQ